MYSETGWAADDDYQYRIFGMAFYGEYFNIDCIKAYVVIVMFTISEKNAVIVICSMAHEIVSLWCTTRCEMLLL